MRKPKLKREGAGCFSKSERQKLQRLYTQGGVAYGSVCNLVKASKFSVIKVRQFLHSKQSYTNLTLATSKLKQMKAFTRFKIKCSCMDLEYIDELPKDNNSVMYLLVRQNLFERTVYAKGLKRLVHF